MTTATTSPVTAVPAADPATARAHFAARLAVESDCSDVHAALQQGDPGVLVLDVRSREAYAGGHVPGAVSLPYREIDASTADLLAGRTAVTYCWGPHCNAATKGALRLADLGLPVKEMIGGVSGWLAEGYPLATGEDAGGA